MQRSDNTKTTEPSRTQRRTKAAEDALRSLIRDTLLDKFPALKDSVDELPLTLALKVNCSESGELTFDPELREQVIAQAYSLLQNGDAFQYGRVYDFHEQSHQTPECIPPNATAVFSGYDPFGHPQWSQIDMLLAKKTSAKIFSGKDLKTEQLQAYGKNDKAFNILGQLILGPLRVPKAYQTLTESTEWALTLQVVETRDAQNHFGLQLNLLAGRLLPDELLSMLEDKGCRALADALATLYESVTRMEQKACEAWSNHDHKRLENILKKVPQILGQFSKDFLSD